MESVEKKQLLEKASSNFVKFLDERKAGLKSFTRKKYPVFFEMLKHKYQQMFTDLNMLFLSVESKESLLEELSGQFAAYGQKLTDEKKWKFQKENIQADCNIFMITYVIPLILDYEYEMSEIFAEKLLQKWNDTFHTNMEAGSYAQICSGFRTGIFGISFGEGK